MTSVLPDRAVRDDRAAPPPRPLALVALPAGVAAAAGPLLVCLAVGVTGWFLADAGSHGEPRDGLRAAALGWLSAHGSGVRVEGVPVGAVPLGLSLVCAWVLWRVSLRVGELVSGHGPDAHRIADGERDWTVPAAGLLLGAGYTVVAVLTVAVAGTPATAPSLPATVLWCVLLCALLGVPGVAVGSGRAAIWASMVPPVLTGVLGTARRIVRWWLVTATALVVVALVVDLGTAANVLAQLGTSPAESVLLVGLCLLLVPNAVLLGGAYLLGPGFAVGAGTVVSPTAVVLGPVPVLPLLAALPDPGPTPPWTPWLVAVPFLLAAVVAARTERRDPAARIEESAVRAVGGGVLAGLVVGLATTLAGGAVGPGRMRVVGSPGLEVTVHAVAALGLGALLGALAVVGTARWTRRRHEARASAASGDETSAEAPA